jgi:energy-coupling factor transport system permease protein
VSAGTASVGARRRIESLDAAGPLLLGALAGSLVAARFETALLCSFVAIAVMALGGAPWPGRRWFASLGIAMATALLLNLYLTRGTPLDGPRLFGAAPTHQGLRHGALLGLRLAGAALAIQGLRGAWPGERAADELARLLRPLERLGVPVREARAMIGLALRFAPLLVAEGRRIAALQDSRAGRPPRGLAERLARRRAAVVPTMVAALERAEQTALAFEARHYRLRPLPDGRGASPGASMAGWIIVGSSLFWRS